MLDGTTTDDFAPADGAGVDNIDLAHLETLDPRIMRVWRAALGIWAVTIVPMPALVGLLTGTTMAMLSVTLLLAGVAAMALVHWPRARYESWGYRIRASDVVLRRGVWWKTVSVVPHARIQHVDTRRGPLERTVGLASVTIHTAGSVGGLLNIPGLEAGDAERLRDRLAALSGASDAV
ncbi:MAG TPA: PH domain-containing protein [Gemmatimonadaceae bacterium]|nr:PH domain-containing protein [Gemmatimonadaceae bacterium]